MRAKVIKYKIKFQQEHQRAGGDYSVPATNIYMRNISIGQLVAEGPENETEPEKWTLRLKVKANEKSLAENPKCPWRWMIIKPAFDSEMEGRFWLAERAEIIFGWLCDEHKTIIRPSENPNSQAFLESSRPELNELEPN